MTDKNNQVNIDKKLYPSFDNNYMAIAMSASNEYVPYLSACLQSIVDNTVKNKNYDIFVFTDAITPDNKDILLEQIERDNIKLRFVDPSMVFKDINLHIANQYYSKECYYRLSAPLLLEGFEKILFTDADLVFNKNFDEVFDMDISNFAYAAVKCPIIQSYLNNPASDIKTYLRDTIKLDDNFNYLNTGVLLINVSKFRENDIFNKCLELVAENKYRFQEQCALSALSSKFWCKLPLKFNYTPMNTMWANDNVLEFMPKEIKQEFMETQKQAVIVHYPGGYTKPWLKPDEKLAYIWWKYARKSPFYEQILKNMYENSIKIKFNALNEQLAISDIKKFNDICAMLNLSKNLMKYWKYNILKNFVFGKTRQRYKNKKALYKEKIKQARQFISRDTVQ